MSFADLLKAKDEATSIEEKTAAALAKATAAVQTAQAAVSAAADQAEAKRLKAAGERDVALKAVSQKALDEQTKARAAADKASTARLATHQAIFDYLAGEGDHYVTEADGSVTVYKAQEISDTSPGWRVLKPKSAQS